MGTIVLNHISAADCGRDKEGESTGQRQDKRGETVEQSSELWEELPGCGVRTDAAASCGHQHNSDRIHLKAAGHFQKNFNADIQPDIYF